MSGYTPFEDLLHKMRREARLLSKSLSRAPEGQLYIVQNGEYLKYLRIAEESGLQVRRGIGRDKELTAKLAHKRYVEEKLRRQRHNIELLEFICSDSLSLDESELLAAMPKHYDKIEREALFRGRSTALNWPHPSRDPDLKALWPPLDTGGLTPEEWAAQPYRENTKNLEHKINRTLRGVLCRSKSELNILDMYDDLRIPFHNDETHRVNGELISPDVTGARADRRLVYHEHLGRQDAGYLQHIAHKVGVYAQAGIFIGKNLLFTYDNEDGSIDLDLIRAQIMNIYGLR